MDEVVHVVLDGNYNCHHDSLLLLQHHVWRLHANLFW